MFCHFLGHRSTTERPQSDATVVQRSGPSALVGPRREVDGQQQPRNVAQQDRVSPYQRNSGTAATAQRLPLSSQNASLVILFTTTAALLALVTSTSLTSSVFIAMTPSILVFIEQGEIQEKT